MNQTHDQQHDDEPDHSEFSTEPAVLGLYPPWQADFDEMDDGYGGQGLESMRDDARSCTRRKKSFQLNAILARGLAGALEAALADVQLGDLPTTQTYTARHLDEIAALQTQIIERMRQNLKAH